ncbi:hypothetical protein COI41_26185 [Bacillus toyonensis]|uniref:hypothetical protein n=1 Tax=Bacillus toyonensis TaxID=155322 RepID=UPI000BFD42B7|nr:hypothetical protein [Bacillus toyonensis]PHF50620.1 hypothetical protein COI41_26185 [Bacillus toyonensis]
MKFLLHTRKIKGLRTISYYLMKVLGLEIPKSVKIGRNVCFEHWGYGVVLHPNTIIEDNVKIYQGVTTGRGDIYTSFENSQMDKIIIKESAILCAGSKIICKSGVLVVDKGTIIGANAVLLSSTGINEVWGGIPAKKLKSRG